MINHPFVLPLCVAAMVTTLTPPAPAQPVDAPRSSASTDDFEGYDFGHVVEAMETSVNPLQREMDKSFRVFVDRIEAAEALLDEGRTHEAVEQAAAALDVVLDVRDAVLTPMWDGQQVLVEQIAAVRTRLARAVQAAGRSGAAPLDEKTEGTLDTIAQRIAAEPDELRKKRLVAHYRTVRNLARIRSMAAQLSPDQRAMWMSVLKVLDEAALAHQQVMMGSEVLFAQFEATSSNLRAYVSLLDTVEGASRLIQVVRGVGEQGAGMAGFASSMIELQQRLAGFNESVEQALEGRMLDLESEIELIEPIAAGMDGGTIPIDEDLELAARMARVIGEQGETP